MLERLKKEILSGLALSKPDPSKRFYINKYWSKDGILELLLQVDVPEDSINSEAQ